MTGLDADLATLVEMASWEDDEEAEALGKSVEAEVARLRRERDEWKRWSTRQGANKRAEAAEREVARLQEGLRHIEAQPDSPGAADYMRAHARALQAEDGAAAKNIGGWDEDGTRTFPSPQAEDGAA